MFRTTSRSALSVTSQPRTTTAASSSTEGAKAWFASLGAEPGIQAQEEFTAFTRAEHARFGTLIREAGVNAE
jgi:tripartite-type tricarboxylate transporter receptor subunit TctC